MQSFLMLFLFLPVQHGRLRKPSPQYLPVEEEILEALLLTGVFYRVLTSLLQCINDPMALILPLDIAPGA